MSHPQGKVPVGSFDEQMVVIGHEAVGVAKPIVSFIDMLKGIEEVLTILVVFKDGLFFITPGGDMIDGAGIFYTERACHDATVSRKCGNV